MITKQRRYSPIATSVASELKRRRNCRHGLRGVKVRVRAHDGLFEIYHTSWGKHEQLFMTVFPADGPRPFDPNFAKARTPYPGADYSTWTDEELGIVRLSDLKPMIYPPGTLHDIRPEECTLMSRWPIVCCKPRRRRAARARESSLTDT
jgi:hypothetical protein